jgi:hypothetical protein
VAAGRLPGQQHVSAAGSSYLFTGASRVDAATATAMATAKKAYAALRPAEGATPAMAVTDTMPAPRLRPSRPPNDSATITAAARSSALAPVASALATGASVQKRYSAG